MKQTFGYLSLVLLLAVVVGVGRWALSPDPKPIRQPSSQLVTYSAATKDGKTIYRHLLLTNLPNMTLEAFRSVAEFGARDTNVTENGIVVINVVPIW